MAGVYVLKQSGCEYRLLSVGYQGYLNDDSHHCMQRLNGD